MTVMVVLLLLIDGVECDAANLLRNGDFIDIKIQFQSYPMQDVLAHGVKSGLPYWTCVHGGVQLWDTQIYNPPIAVANATYIVHMNSRVGGGHIVSMPMYTSRENAEYVVSMSLACNPHGGPRRQSLQAIVFDDQGKEIVPKPSPFVLMSNPNSSMDNLDWMRVSFKTLGTGKCLYLYLMSLVRGYYGLLVANIQVNIVNLVENGSFEKLILPAGTGFASGHDLVVTAPDKFYCPHWNVESGKVRVAMTGSTIRVTEPGRRRYGFFMDNEYAFQSATDGGRYTVELNAGLLQGVISTMFWVPSNSSSDKDHEYVLLFDTAANPILEYAQLLPGEESPVFRFGKMKINIMGSESGKVLLENEYENMNTSGFEKSNLGWLTRNYTFKMPADKSAKITFSSLTKGSYGPLLDNVVIYEVKDKDQWRKECTAAINAEANTNTSGSDKERPPVIVAEKLAVLVMTKVLFLVVVSMR